MKKIILALGALALLFNYDVKAQGPEAFSLTPNATAIAATTTNSTAGTAKFIANGENPIRIYLSASGVAATTSGVFTVKFSTASGQGTTVTNNYDTAALSNIKLSISNTINEGTVTVSDWFVINGAGYIRIGQIENSFLGPVSNITVKVGYRNAQ